MEHNEISYRIRWAKVDEWAPAMKMIWKTFMRFEAKDYTEEGIQNFFDFVSDDGLHKAFLRGDYQLMVALDGERVVGAGSIRNRNHLSLLFVDEDYHYRGVGAALITKLCEYLKLEEGERFMSVNAAPYALGFYSKLGFIAVAPEEEYAGIRVTRMEKIF